MSEEKKEIRQPNKRIKPVLEKQNFRRYISQITKKNFPDNSLSSSVLDELSLFIRHFAQELARTSRSLSKKSTITDSDIKSSVAIFLTGELKKEAIIKGTISVENFSKSKDEKKSGTKAEKAGLVFPPSRFEKIIRAEVGFEGRVGENASVFLAGVCEYITFEILEIAGNITKDNNQSRIKLRYLMFAIENDEEISKLVKKLNVKFQGFGVVPGIDTRITERKKTNKKRTSNNNVSLKNIRQLQKQSECLMIPKGPFKKMIKNISSEHIDDNDKNIRVSSDCSILLQYYIEARIVELLQNANMIALHSNRLRVTPDDIDLVRKIKN